MDNKTKEIITGTNEELLELLRTGARDGKTVCELVKLIRASMPKDNQNPVSVMRNFINAFNLSLKQVQEMQFAPCMGGENDITNEYINEEIGKHIKKHFLDKD